MATRCISVSWKAVNTKTKPNMEDRNTIITNFARRVYNLLSKNTVLGSNDRTNAAITACIMYDDMQNNGSRLMDTVNFNGDMTSIILAISKVNESTGLIRRMDDSGNMTVSIKLFSSEFYGEIHPEKTLPMKMCYADKVRQAIGI